MLDIRSLNAFYGRTHVLKDTTLSVPEGKIISIIGVNGAGKSTLLKSISGLISRKTGTIRFNGADITHVPPHKIVGLGIAQVPEGRQLFSHLTVRDNIRLGAYLYFKKRNREEIQNRVSDIYKMYPVLYMRSNQVAGTLSGGEQQMLAIARGLMCRPRLLLLDEPSMGIAPKIVQQIFSDINSLNHSGTTILLVEQNARAALRVSHYSYVLESGRIVLEGPSETLMDDPAVKKAYLGG